MRRARTDVNPAARSVRLRCVSHSSDSVAPGGFTPTRTFRGDGTAYSASQPAPSLCKFSTYSKYQANGVAHTPRKSAVYGMVSLMRVLVLSVAFVLYASPYMYAMELSESATWTRQGPGQSQIESSFRSAAYTFRNSVCNVVRLKADGRALALRSSRWTSSLV